jgi:hypothetical protein
LEVVPVSPPFTIADQVFILRFWSESGHHGGTIHWRAQIRNVNTRKTYIVETLDAAMEWISTRLNVVASGANETANDD